MREQYLDTQAPGVGYAKPLMEAESPQPAPLYRLDDVRFRYGSGAEVIHGVSFSVGQGEMVGLIGPNGAGKSTLLQLMNGLLRPDAGQVLLRSKDVAKLNALDRARQISFVPQTPSVYFPYTVGEVVAMGRHPYSSPIGGESTEDRSKIQWAMEVTGTTQFARRQFNELSGGETQRVVIARALAQSTPVLILDEPTSSLDLYYQAAVYGLLERLNRDRGMSVVIVTHDVNLAAEYCTRLIGIREGRIVVDGPSREVMTTETIQALYGVQAEILESGGNRVVRVRHLEPSGGGGGGLG